MGILLNYTHTYSLIIVTVRLKHLMSIFMILFFFYKSQVQKIGCNQNNAILVLSEVVQVILRKSQIYWVKCKKVKLLLKIYLSEDLRETRRTWTHKNSTCASLQLHIYIFSFVLNQTAFFSTFFPAFNITILPILS